jgi:hypothetical protein
MLIDNVHFKILGELMRFVGKSKIGRLSAYEGKVYPQIRLPSHLADVIGETAGIFETEHEGKRAFLLVTRRPVSSDDTLLQSFYNIVKSDEARSAVKRLDALESEIKNLKSLLILNKGQYFPKKIKEDESNGLGRIRTGDLRRVKAAFLERFALFSDGALVGAITTRKASAPS